LTLGPTALSYARDERKRERIPLTFIPSVFVTFTSKALILSSEVVETKVYKILPLDRSYVQVRGIAIQLFPI
jgi:hypothetical protein